MSHIAGAAIIAFVIGTFLSFEVVRNVADDARNDLIAERYCHPGMLVQRIENKRALCIGGKGETWIVKIKEWGDP